MSDDIGDRVSRLLGPDGVRLRRARGGGLRTEGAASQEGAGGPGPGRPELLGRVSGRLAQAARENRVGFGPGEAEALAHHVLTSAESALDKLARQAGEIVSRAEAASLEAVLMMRGRPAIRVLGDDLEDPKRYPESEHWAVLVDEHRQAVVKAVSATAAVRVTGPRPATATWVQGSATYLDGGLALTNRHVLFPPFGGTRIARRVPGTATAQLKRDYDVVLDFAFDGGPSRKSAMRVKEILFVAADDDPVDAAVLKVEPIDAVAPESLAVSEAGSFGNNRLYVVGHPGLLPEVPEAVAAVFGQPDERKRVSFGLLMENDGGRQPFILHDASTIGGYSGGGVYGFGEPRLEALHYWGDSVGGNRAIPASRLRGHPILAAILKAAP